MTRARNTRRRKQRRWLLFYLTPVCMTALAMIIGMLPMALSLGSGGEQNAPIGRAVIGGLLFATVGTLLIVPVFYSLFSRACR